MDWREPDSALQQRVQEQHGQRFTAELSRHTPQPGFTPRSLRSSPSPCPSPHLSLASSPLCPPKGLKPGLRGDAGLQGEEWPERPREALRLRLLSRPCRLLPPSRLTRRRSRRPVGRGWPSSSPSSWRRVDWGEGKREEGEPSAGGSGTVGPTSGKQ